VKDVDNPPAQCASAKCRSRKWNKSERPGKLIEIAPKLLKPIARKKQVAAPKPVRIPKPPKPPKVEKPPKPVKVKEQKPVKVKPGAHGFCPRCHAALIPWGPVMKRCESCKENFSPFQLGTAVL